MKDNIKILSLLVMVVTDLIAGRYWYNAIIYQFGIQN